MNRGSTIFLRLVILTIGLVVLALCVYGIPQALMSDVGGYRLILLGMYVPAIPFFIALYQGFKLLDYIDKNQTFSNSSTKVLGNIKYCGIVISGLYVLGMPYVLIVAERDDAPGVVLIGLIIIGASLVIAAAAGLFQRLLQNAIDIKSENDLTV
ncbi:MAG: DUF2975 domain-containing protein [Candidatus Saccharimonadales bacterium]